MEPSKAPENKEGEIKEKTYVQSKKRWTDFDLHPEIAQYLK